jgi:hypothetical protein
MTGRSLTAGVTSDKARRPEPRPRFGAVDTIEVVRVVETVGDAVHRISNPTQHYAWGSATAIPDLLGVEARPWLRCGWGLIPVRRHMPPENTGM